MGCLGRKWKRFGEKREKGQGQVNEMQTLYWIRPPMLTAEWSIKPRVGGSEKKAKVRG